MAKKIIDNTPLADFYDDWGGVNQSGREWGKSHKVVEDAIKDKMQSVEDGIGGKVAGVIVNGQEVPKDENGKVQISVPTVDASLSEESTNTVQNAVVAKEFNDLWGKAIDDVHTEAVEGDVNMLNLVFNNRNGENIVTVPIPSGGSSGSSSYPKVTTNLLTPTRIKLGDTIRMEWSYDHIIVEDGESSSSGVAAQSIVVSVMIGTTQIYTESYTEVACGTSRTLVLNPEVINQAGTVNVYVRATTIYNDQEQRTQGFKSVTVIAMSLAAPNYNPAEWLAQGGYNENQSTVSIQCQHSVPSNSTLHIFLDGEDYSSDTISGAGIKRVLISLQGLASGGHNIRLVAESDGLLSNALSLDFLKAGGQDNYLGISVSFDVNNIEDVPTLSPIPLALEQFGELEQPIGAWNASSPTSVVTLSVGGDVVQTINVPRTQQVIRQRIDTLGEVSVEITNGNASLPFVVSVSTDVNVDETETQGYITKIEAEGRSNSEEHPDDWGGITTFRGVDWASNGWVRGTDGVTALTLTNGARAVVDIKPFVAEGGYSIQNSGMAFEFEFMISQVTQRGATVISCLYDNDGSGYPMGIKVTTAEASLFFGGVEEIVTAEEDEHGDPIIIRRPYGTSMNIAVDRWVHVAFVVQRASQGQGIAMMYINGVLSRANIYTSGLVQNEPQPITFYSDKADIRVRGIRYYRIPLTSDEVLANHVIGRPTPLAIQSLHIKNAVTGVGTDADGNKNIDFGKLREKGRGVLTIIRSDDSGDGLADLFTCTDKKQNFIADIVKWDAPLDSNGNPIGDGFEARNVRIRIQGTSSVKYPYKNIRIYLTTAGNKNQQRELYIGGVNVTDTAKGYPMRGASKSIEQAVLCAKTDFVDSSLTLNTGGAHLFHDTMNALTLKTPPQEYDERVRQAIDGIPCDVFAATSELGELTYYGQFVLNNEKSKSGKIFGMEGVDGFEPSCPLSFEALVNSSPITLFQPAGSADSQELEDQLQAEFDKGFEFNFPEDVWYNEAKAMEEMGADYDQSKNLATEAQRTAIKTLFGWIYDCMEDTEGVQNETMSIAEPDYGDRNGWGDESKAKWVSQKFKDEASQHFNVNHLLTYYLITDYWASVDQRAKNILWRTWDGVKWYSTYYDGDTSQSIRNDAFMVYLYDVTRDTYDYERSKYAFEGHNSWLWCLVLANFEDELKTCAETLRRQLSTTAMLNEFNGVMMDNWSERQYNKSGKLKYIDTISRMNYVYTLTGTRELHRTQFLTDRNKLLDARYGAGNYGADVITFTVVRQSTDRVSSLTIVSNDLYYFGYKLNNRWLQGPTICKADESLALTFVGTLATNDPLMLGGASCIKELDMTDMGSQLNGDISFSNCTALERLIMPQTEYGAFNGNMTFGETSKLQYVDFTGQVNIAGIIDLSKHTRLNTFKALGTRLTRVVLADGAPVTTLELPATLTTLVLRYFPLLDMESLTLENANSVTALNMAGCPNLSWMEVLDTCPNIRRVRIEGMSGIIRSERLTPFMSGYTGFDENGNEQELPAFTGTVRLANVVDNFDEMQAFFRNCGLTILPNEYTDYWFDDLEADPANITNEDNKTGHAYLDPEIQDMYDHPNRYVASGHVKLLHDLCQPVAGKINERTGAMTVRRLSKTSFYRYENGDNFNPTDPDGTGTDVYLYVPHYWYKGVNDYKNARKHFFLSTVDQEPTSTATNVQRYALPEMIFASGKAVDNQLMAEGEDFDVAYLATAASYNTYKVPVNGMKMARFPSVNHQNFSCAFVDADGVIVAMHTLNMETSETNPADFMNDEGDYDFRPVPESAEWLYFTCKAFDNQSLEAIVTDSEDIEAVEPEWVEHQPELIGIYQGFVPGITTGGTVAIGPVGLRSISGKTVSRGSGTYATNPTWTYDEDGNPTSIPTSSINGTAQEFFNLARYRGEGYSTVPYETSKNMANLFMVWFGTRNIESIVGEGGTAGYSTGTRDSVAFDDTNILDMGPASPSTTNQFNKIWGLEAWTGSCLEWMDNACFNAASFRLFKRNRRQASAVGVTDYYYRIMMSDGTERKVKAEARDIATTVARVRFGKYCDIIVSAYSNDVSAFAAFYAAAQSAVTTTGGVLGRSYYRANARCGVAYITTDFSSQSSGTYHTARLCYNGEIVESND